MTNLIAYFLQKMFLRQFGTLPPINLIFKKLENKKYLVRSKNLQRVFWKIIFENLKNTCLKHVGI